MLMHLGPVLLTALVGNHGEGVRRYIVLQYPVTAPLRASQRPLAFMVRLAAQQSYDELPYGMQVGSGILGSECSIRLVQFEPHNVRLDR